MRRTRTLVTTIGVLALALSACGGSDGGADGGDAQLADGQTFTMTLPSDPGNLDPLMTVLSNTRQVGRFLYGTLVDQDPDGTVVPAIAESWEATTTEATFTLREGITCSDGSPFTASDVAETLNWVADPANQSPLAGLWVQPGTKATADDDARTVSVTSSAPDAFLALNLGTVPLPCGEGLSDPEVRAEGKGGTGMFTVTEAVPNDHYTFTRRDDYTWGPGEDFDPEASGLPDEVVFRVVENETTSANLLTSGEVNAASIAGPDQDRLSEQGLFHADVSAPVGQIWFNQAEGRPAADDGVRSALVQALDLDELRTVMTSGKGETPQSLVALAPNPCQADSVGDSLPEHDADAAASALDDAGWTAGGDGTRTKDGAPLSLKVVYTTQFGETGTATAELLQQTLGDLGVEVKLQGVDSTSLNEVLFATGDWDLSLAPLSVGMPSQLVPFMSGPTPPNGTNFANISNDDYSELTASAASQSGTDGCGDWSDAETALFEQLDVVPFANSVVPTFGNDTEFEIEDGIDPASIRMYQ
ncbi:peptide/nickel transport system substrate-binding protein [Mumia flava]|uniref:Peptide/nickel transport system substrate-binding protein n=1 Tax=Mumia flava TaxID=1348852 RepID=A0A0B2BJX4_9ACTN|nr:ABC transporter substrate-binding protein [Mumia flava]PJJ53694.1 peptide/nickel transport system substrate-binding protein [Mumia flava]